jgi:putative transposase
MYKAYKYRLYPTEKQKAFLEKHFGACRFIYNLALETKINAYKSYGVNLSRFELQKQMVELKQDLPWLKDISSRALISALINLDDAYKSFFRGKGFPRFKSKKEAKSFSASSENKIKGNKIQLCKFKEGIKAKITRAPKGLIKTMTVLKTPTGKYYAIAFIKEDNSLHEMADKNGNNPVGIDLGLSHFMITSNGEKVENPKYLQKSIKRLEVLQRRLSKKKRGSKNRKKASLKIAKQYEKISNKRLDFLHKTSTTLVRDSQADTICMEDLAVKNMVKNHNLAQAISDVSWGKFLELVKYKCDWYGKNLIIIDRFYPSSKTCSNCGNINKELKLSEREWTCDSCWCIHDRDINAAINIRNSGTGCAVEPVESLTVVKAMKQEKQE